MVVPRYIMNSTTNFTASPLLIWLVQSAFDNLFKPSSYVQTFRSSERTRAGINVLFLGTEIGGFFCNFYLTIRVIYFLNSMQMVKSHYRAIIFYNQYTYASVGLGLHLGIVGVLSCALILASHVYLIHLVTNNQLQSQPKIDSMLSCNYIPFLRDALNNVYLYILLTLMVIYRRADIRSASKKTRSTQGTKLIARRQRAKMVLLHSLPWVLSLGLSLPRGLLDMRLDFRNVNPHKMMEAALSEELCLRRSNDSDIVQLCMWALQAWIPIILCVCLCIIYSCKDKPVRRHHINRRLSNTTLGGKTTDSAIYSSSRTLYSLHNYKEEIIKLIKTSPVAFYSILFLTLLLRLPFTLTSLIDNCHYLLHSTFVFNHVLVILSKDLEYAHLALLPLLMVHTIISLVNNSLKINEIREKLKKMTDNDDYLKNSVSRFNGCNNTSDVDDVEKPFMLSTV